MDLESLRNTGAIDLNITHAMPNNLLYLNTNSYVDGLNNPQKNI